MSYELLARAGASTPDYDTRCFANQCRTMSTPYIRFQNISKGFANRQALTDVNLSIEGGQIFGLLGPNGAGKTTLLRILSTLLQPDSGHAELVGIDVQKQALQARNCLGLVNANMGLYQRLSGRENLRFFAEVSGFSKVQSDQRIAELMQQLQIEDWIDQKSSGYSTGMRQKIIVARAILHRPQVLVLDEASNGLDVFARRALTDLAKDYAEKGNLVIYCTHVMSEAEALCQRAAILHEGKVLAEASLDELKARTNTDNLEDAFFALAVSRNRQQALLAS
jgi:sodium transport system ATP-binding protein